MILVQGWHVLSGNASRSIAEQYPVRIRIVLKAAEGAGATMDVQLGAAKEVGVKVVSEITQVLLWCNVGATTAGEQCEDDMSSGILYCSAASSTRTHSAWPLRRAMSSADVPFQLLRGSPPRESSCVRQAACPFWAAT